MLKFTRFCDRIELYSGTLRWICTAEIRPSHKTHYEILHLNRDATSKEVRDAFIKLSKQMHPDKNVNDPLNHLKFVKLNEAYSVLSRPNKRSAYDLSLRNEQQIKRSPTSYSTRSSSQHSTVHTDLYEHYNFWKPEYNRTRSDKHHSKRLSKSWIVFLCVIFASAGVGLQIFAIRSSLTFSRKKLDKMTEENSKILGEVRHQASQNSLEKQIELMKHRMENSFGHYNESKRTNE
ncbi:dnaJ homolog subfamily C member 4-like [Hetaerina americana]|uniref:dnaJ homolog subfamily C member 4-like n=1 Tax=Hetaerina americana TaxID=62018 RepID=UPI003A7F49D4